EELESEISSAFKKDPLIDKWQIEIKTDHGIVYLNGTVDSYFEKLHAEEIASKIDGVVDIQNNLVVYNNDEAYFFNYYGWNTYLPPYEIEINKEYMDDSEIESEIKNQLWWSPFVNEDEIEVSVEDGKAVLTGMVDSRREKMYAEINALEGGARQVQNKIIVKREE
ncbi:MAG: BON domain-containing protein, partial [Bacteroidota bacterium]